MSCRGAGIIGLLQVLLVVVTAVSLLTQIAYTLSSSSLSSSSDLSSSGISSVDLDAPFSFGYPKDNNKNKNNKNNNKKNTSDRKKRKKDASSYNNNNKQNDNFSSSSCLDPNGPIPVILMSLGRSGSSSVWDVMGNLTGQMTRSEETTGKDTPASKVVFEKIQPVGDDSWLLQKLCQQQQKYPNAGLVGFKWKPNEVSLHHPTAQAGLKLLSKLGGIKVVRSQRNELDVIVSQEKHGILNRLDPTHEIHEAHCTQGDVQCKALHKKATLMLELDIPKLVRRLRKMRQHQQNVDMLLNDMNISFVSVSYDKLYFDDHAEEEWKRLFSFLKPPNWLNHLTKQDIQNAQTYTSTSSRDQRTNINNFDNVAALLRGTEFEGLLRSESIYY